MMSRKKIGLGLIALIAISVGIMLSLNQSTSVRTEDTSPIDVIEDGNSTLIEYQYMPVQIHSKYFWGDSHIHLYLYVTPKVMNISKEVDYEFVNATVQKWRKLPNNETHRGFQELDSEFTIPEDAWIHPKEYMSYYLYDITNVNRTEYSFTTWAWIKVIK